MNEHTRDFTREGCIVGVWKVTYKSLIRWYVCRECGGLPVPHIGVEGDETIYWAECGTCGYRDFITARWYRKQLLEFQEILENLPPFLRELVPQPEPLEMTGAEAISQLFDY